jgi:hypothetical protein
MRLRRGGRDLHPGYVNDLMTGPQSTYTVDVMKKISDVPSTRVAVLSQRDKRLAFVGAVVWILAMTFAVIVVVTDTSEPSGAHHASSVVTQCEVITPAGASKPTKIITTP